MGKSPGKWIKGLFGKKSSKSNLSEQRELSRSASKKEPIPTLIVDTPQISNEVPLPISIIDEGESAKLPNDELVSSSAKQDADIIDMSSDPSPPNGAENIRLEQAATVVQASLRSYQARTSFETLKGIVRMQAIVRGHLVRRQAIATLFCVQSIVKFQAVTRGRIVRQSAIASGLCKRQSLVEKDSKHTDYSKTENSAADNLLKNAFVYSLLSSSSTRMPLRLQYGPSEPNSAWEWLLRWSISKVWAPPYSGQKETVQTEQIRPNAEIEKLEHKERKLSHQSAKSALETGNNKVRHGVKKIPKKSSEEISNQAEFDFLPSDKDCQVSVENYKSSRRTSLPYEHEDCDVMLESGTRVPSYMARTASSKAKVRVNVSPRFGQDAVDKKGLTRRFSLPTSANGKSSLSPRVRVLVQGNGGEGLDIDRSLSSSRGNIDKVIQVDWKR
ncbi:hypothetical protein ABFS82_12G105500 [Erythranthe guttata]|uniref:protein IQ-DOMAIN 31-like n=1 Tax=Erythranthe guttata TaxID=4155 RepID=UPI00064D9CAC|nr:PREDICTED: protein IQ-DOMAIN 31-like [Erythranthe guttata]|eukprot:XP_012847720.1 PREDICTED: protein IQ-DOMAIN 31-like [Erythranthe guttata]